MEVVADPFSAISINTDPPFAGLQPLEGSQFQLTEEVKYYPGLYRVIFHLFCYASDN